MQLSAYQMYIYACIRKTKFIRFPDVQIFFSYEMPLHLLALIRHSVTMTCRVGRVMFTEIFQYLF